MSSRQEDEEAGWDDRRASRARLGPPLLAVLIGALDLTVIATILPRMVSDLRINTVDIDRYVWVVNGYLLAYIVAIPIMGRVSDILGRRSAFLISLGIFIAGSAWCARADDLPGLIAGRAVQGAGGGALLPVTMALVGDVVPPAGRLAALGIVGAVDTLGWVLGPLWGAAIVGLFSSHTASWRWVFYVNIPMGIIAAIAIVLLDRRRTAPQLPAGSRRIDLLGTVLLSAMLVLLNLALSSGSELGQTATSGSRALGGTSNPLAGYLLPMLLGVLVFAGLFIFWERRVRFPILPLTLFHDRRFTAAMTANFITGVALIVAMVNVPIVIALLVSEGAVSAISAVMLAPFTVLMAALSFTGGIVARRRGERATAAIGLILVAAGYALLWLGLRGGDYRWMFPGLAVAGAGFGLVIAPIGATVLDAVPATDRGVAAGLTLVFRLLGMTIGISTLTSIGIRRLQTLTGRLQTIVRRPGESTVDFLLRQNQFIEDRVIPLSIQVIRETFLIAGLLALIAIIPVLFLGRRDAEQHPAPPSTFLD